MNAIPSQETGAVRPLHVVLMVLVVATVAGGSLLLSAAESNTLVDGAIEWRQESLLRAIVQLLCLNYRFPTLHQGAIKVYLLGIGSGLAILSLSIAIAVRGRGQVENAGNGGVDEPASDTLTAVPGRAFREGQLAPLIAAQVLVGLYLLWSFASSRVSTAPDLAVGGSVLLTIHFMWAFALGNGLTPSAARVASRCLVAITAVTAAVALWYYYGRNPTLRAKFPFGNPSFLAASLIPGLLLAVTFVCEKASSAIRARGGRSIGLALAGVVGIVVVAWAFHLTKSRGPALGLGIGLIAVVFFALMGRAKWIPVFVALAAITAAAAYYSSVKEVASPTGRSATIRFRTYAWEYAWRMFNARPFTGHGQGGFALTGDRYAVEDVLDDPEVLNARIAHAHNEWLEVMADLGSVGIVLLATALILTFRAGMIALQARPPTEVRWALVGLMAALVGLIVEESFGVGLRVSGVPTWFFTILGLIWALGGYGASGLARLLSATRKRRLATGVAGISVGLAILTITQQDFDAARAAYRVEEHIQAGDYEQAIQAAARARTRLNPQRALANLHRLSAAHTLIARTLQDRAIDREARAARSDVPESTLRELASQDRELSDRHCRSGSAVLKELVTKSPGTVRHGWVLYWLNTVQAANAVARGQPEEAEQFMRDAAAALERELARWPFDLTITMEYLHVAQGVLEPDQFVSLLARPLRHHRIAATYANFLALLAEDPTFEGRFDPVLEDARRILGAAGPSEEFDDFVEVWGPEKLRIVATIRFRRGDYERAAMALGLAAKAYDRLAVAAPIGAASCYAELADSQFFSRPETPTRPIATAQRALALAPESLEGRQLKASVKMRLVDYHLAADQETEARALLREATSAEVEEERVGFQLGLRYRQLCESLLTRRLAYVLRQSPNDLIVKLDRWVRRALELNPEDYAAHYLAADLAFHKGQCDEAVTCLRRSLDHGLSTDVARQFLQVAREKAPECEALAVLLDELIRSHPEQPPGRDGGSPDSDLQIP